MYTKALKELLKEVDHDFRFPLELDLSDPKHAGYIEACFGGKEYFSTSYPALYSAFQNGKELSKNRASANASRQGFQNAAHIIDVLYDEHEKCVCSFGDMNLTEVAGRLYLCLDIYKDDELIAHNTDYFINAYCGQIDCNSIEFEIPQGEVQRYKAVLTAVWQPSSSNALRAMLAATASDVDYGTNEDFVESLTVLDPVHRVTREPAPITVAYGRKSSSIDYAYPETKDPVTKDEMVFLDVSGNARLAEGHTFERFTRAVAYLKCDGLGDIVYLNEIKEGQNVYATEDGKCINWKLNHFWNDEILGSTKYYKRLNSFDFKLQFYCKNDQAEHKIIVSSDNYPQLKGKKYYKKIPQIQLLWGCITGDMLIRMGDFTQKAAENIVVGDTVADINGNKNRVVNVITGTESIICHLVLESGKELKATDDHPIYTSRGMIKVTDIDSDTQIAVEKPGGGYAYEYPLYCYPEEYTGKVYSFELDNGSSISANGIFTGAYKEQGELADRNNEKRLNTSGENPEILAEIERLKQDDKDGKIFR